MRVFAKDKVIKHLLIDKNLSIKDLSVLTGVNHSYLNCVVNCKVHTTGKTASLIAKELNKNVNDLFILNKEEEKCLNK